MYAKSLWAGWLTLALVPAGASPLWGQNSNRIGVAEQIRTITSRIKSPEDREQAEKALRQLDAATVLELIFPEIERLADDPDAASQFGGYFLPEEKISDARMALLALNRLWSHCIEKDSVNHGTLLLNLLKASKTDASKRWLLSALQHHYVPDAEEPLSAILRDRNAIGWIESALVLLQHRPEKYGPVLLDHLESKKESLDGRIVIFQVFSLDSFTRMDERHRKRLIRSGFALIEAERLANPNHKGAGYFPAVWVRAYLKTAFAWPNQGDRKYRTPDGNNLNEAFFEDMARNALAWWTTHRKDYE
jgi:hypothetical protein